LTRTISSKNLKLEYANATPSADGSKLNLEDTLRKKIHDKNSKILKLERELNIVRAQYIEQRERLT
jgi:hypothetical protein